MANKKKSTNTRSGAGSVSRTARTAAAGKRPSAGRRSAPAPAAKQEGLGRDIFGIVLIFLGLLLGVFCYFGSTGLLSVAAPVLFGMTGILTYAMPVLLIALGILLIALERRDLKGGSIICIVTIFLALLALIHVISRGKELTGAKFGEALSGAITLGKAHHGGGFLGGLFGYLFVLLAGVTGAIIILIGIMLIAALLLTHFSINAHVRKLREQHQANASVPRKSRYKPYNEDLRESRREKNGKKADAQNGEDEEFIEHTGKPLTSGDSDYDYDKRRSAANKARAEAAQETESARRLREHRPLIRKPAKDDGPDFLPVSGPLGTGRLPKKRGRDAELKDSFNTEGSSSGWQPTTYKPVSDRPKKPAYTDFEIADDDPVISNEPIDIPDDPLDGVVISRYDDEKNANTGVGSISVTYDDGTGESGANEEKPKKPEGDSSAADAVLPEQNAVVYEYKKPPLELLKLPDAASGVASEPPEEKARILIETLNSFNISARIVNISVGPVITRYELQPAQGVRVNRITSLSNDIALALAAPRVRIEAPIPGKSAIGIEIPNRSTVAVLLRELLETNEFNSAKSPLTFALGKDIAGKVVLGDLSKMPHMLVAGQTGSGKSVCINGIILSMVYKSSPKDVRMILIDPKVVELSIFSTLPHLFCPVVTEPKKAAGALRWAVNEMDSRYRKMAEVHARDIDRYNAVQADDNDRWPRLVIIIDELADLMLVAAKDVEDSICRIAQLGRACGIHLIVATQRPSVDVITGLIKANIPSRIAFAVSNGTDSRVILDASGAEKLLGRGDMLFHPNGASKPTRAQGAFVGDEEVEAVAEFFTKNTAPAQLDFHEDMLSEISSSGSAPGQGNGKQEDELLPDAVRLVIESGQASISMIQRRLRVGYARAARLIDIMEQKNYVSPADGAKPRNVLITAAEFNRVFGGDIPVGGEQ